MHSALELDLNEAKAKIVGSIFLGIQFVRSQVFKARHPGKTKGGDKEGEIRSAWPTVDAQAEINEKNNCPEKETVPGERKIYRFQPKAVIGKKYYTRLSFFMDQ